MSRRAPPRTADDAVPPPPAPARERDKERDQSRPRLRLEVDERRAQLLALALRTFAERSYDEVSIDELARAAGVSKGLVYHYFPAKRDLYVAALREAARQLLEVTASDPAAPPPARVRRGLESYLGFVEAHGPAYVALMRGGIGSDPEVFAVIEGTRQTFLDRVLDGTPPELDSPMVRMALRGFIGFVEATSLDWVARRSMPRERLVDLCAAVLFDMVARASALPPG